MRRAVGLHADRVDDAVRAAAGRALADGAGDVVLGADVDRLDAVAGGELESLRDEVDAEDLPGAAVERDATRHLADRSQAEHRQRAAVRHRGVLHRLPGRRQHVGEVEEALVRRPLGHLDGTELRLGHAQELGLGPGHLAVEPGVAEQRRALAVLGDLRRLALRVQVLVAHEAVTAGDVERHDDAVSHLEVAGLGTDRLDDAHRLVAQDVALGHERPEHLVDVQVGAAQARRGDADDRVRRLLDRRVGNLLDPDVPLAVPCHCAHPGRPLIR